MPWGAAFVVLFSSNVGAIYIGDLKISWQVNCLDDCDSICPIAWIKKQLTKYKKETCNWVTHF
jgi:hypothetical protein